jgi:hypothetical protein
VVILATCLETIKAIQTWIKDHNHLYLITQNEEIGLTCLERTEIINDGVFRELIEIRQENFIFHCAIDQSYCLSMQSELALAQICQKTESALESIAQAQIYIENEPPFYYLEIECWGEFSSEGDLLDPNLFTILREHGDRFYQEKMAKILFKFLML